MQSLQGEQESLDVEFIMFQVETKIREMVYEMQRPVVQTTKDILDGVEANRQKWAELDNKLKTAVNGLHRAQQALRSLPLQGEY